MNVFEVKQTYLGEVNEKAINDAFAEFMNLAKAIRERLGAHKYLLEQYLLGLLHAVSGIPCIDTASDAENFSSYAVAYAGRRYVGIRLPFRSDAGCGHIWKRILTLH